MSKPFVVVAGYGGNGKLISASQVAKNYGLTLDQCVLASSEAMVRGMRVAGMVILYPQPSGDYSLPQLEVAHAG
jgi:hypothetical protein